MSNDKVKVSLTELQAYELKATNSTYMNRNNIEIDESGKIEVTEEQLEYLIDAVGTDYASFASLCTATKGKKISMKSLLKKMKSKLDDIRD